MVLLGCVCLSARSVFTVGPGLGSPLATHWSPSSAVAASVCAALALATVVLALAYQAYLTIIVFKLLCDVSVRFPQTSGDGPCSSSSSSSGTKCVLFYCFFVSLCASCGLALEASVDLALNWDRRDNLDESVTNHFAFAGPFSVFLQGKANNTAS